MSRRINIELETIKHLTAQEELALVQAAFDRSASPAIRFRLASLLVLNDDAKAVIALLSNQADLSAREEMLLAQAWLARKSAEGDAGARAATDRALSLSTIRTNAPPRSRCAPRPKRGWATSRRRAPR